MFFQSATLLALAAIANTAAARNVVVKREMPRPELGSVPYGSRVVSCNSPGKIALTFDDGPGTLTAGIVDTLEKNGVKGTFFMVGVNGNDGVTKGPYESLIRRMYGNGHQVASHSFTHPDFSDISYDEQVEELKRLEEAFISILGVVPTYFRPPYTSCNSDCYKASGDMGYHVTDYDLDTRDWESKGIYAEQNYKSTVESADPNADSFIALAHDIQPFTADGFVQFMIDIGKEKGFEFTTIGECLGDPEANWYRDPESGEGFGGGGIFMPSVSETEGAAESEPVSSSTKEAPKPTKAVKVAAEESSTAAPSSTTEASVSSTTSEEATVSSTHVSVVSSVSSTIVSTSTITSASTEPSSSVASTLIVATTTSSSSSSSPSASSTEEEEAAMTSLVPVDENAGSLVLPSFARSAVIILAGVAAWMLL